MSKEEKDNKEASGCCEGFTGFGFKGFKDAIAACCGTEGERPGGGSMIEKFKNACCGHSEKEDSAGPDNPKKGCC